MTTKSEPANTKTDRSDRCIDCGDLIAADGTCRQCAEGWAYLNYQRSLGERYNGRPVTEDL